MNSERVERRFVAILVVDAAGSTVGGGEEGPLGQLNSLRTALVDPTIAEHGGRIINTIGDGMLVVFSNAADATHCAIEIQRGMVEQNTDLPKNKRITFRMGIHVGAIIDDNDIFGDDVSIAAHLERIAEPGGVCLSDDAHREIQDKGDIAFDDIGLLALRNVAEPMRVWRVQVGGRPASAARPNPLTKTHPPVVSKIDELKNEVIAEWSASPAVEACIRIIDYVNALPIEELEMLTFSSFKKAVGSEEINGEILLAVALLASTSIHALDARLLFIDDDERKIEIEKSELAIARGSGLFIHTRTGNLVSDFESKIVPFFVPSERFLSLKDR